MYILLFCLCHVILLLICAMCFFGSKDSRQNHLVTNHVIFSLHHLLFLDWLKTGAMPLLVLYNHVMFLVPSFAWREIVLLVSNHVMFFSAKLCLARVCFIG